VAGLPAYFLGNQGGIDAMLLPVVTIFELPLKMQYSKRKSIKSGKTVSYFYGSNLGIL